MKFLSNATYFSMQAQIRTQADTIKYLNGEINKLERENVMQAEHIAMIEETLKASGIMNRDGSFRENAGSVLRAAGIVLEKLEELK